MRSIEITVVRGEGDANTGPVRGTVNDVKSVGIPLLEKNADGVGGRHGYVRLFQLDGLQ